VQFGAVVVKLLYCGCGGVAGFGDPKCVARLLAPHCTATFCRINASLTLSPQYSMRQQIHERRVLSRSLEDGLLFLISSVYPPLKMKLASTIPGVSLDAFLQQYQC
jgi:hypothetical protein